MTQAQIRTIDASMVCPATPIQICWNMLAVDVIPDARMSGKYKKVDLQSKLALIGLVRNGASIISAARSLKINYSTAKSIFQNLKAKATGKLKRKRFVETDSEPTSGNLKLSLPQPT